MITIYFAQVEGVLESFPNVCTYTLQKKVYNKKQGYISGQIVFESGERLDFVEVKDTDVEHKLKYRYHYMTPLKKLKIHHGDTEDTEVTQRFFIFI